MPQEAEQAKLIVFQSNDVFVSIGYRADSKDLLEEKRLSSHSNYTEILGIDIISPILRIKGQESHISL